MKFLNKKEQVIDLEITPYGKSLFARGRFKPEFYAFFDTDILYDSENIGVVEHHNSASVRIKEVPQLETQAYFYSAEKQVKEATELQRLTEFERIRAVIDKEPTDIHSEPYVADDGVTIGTIPDRSFSAQPLGSSHLNSPNAPAWNIGVLEGSITGSSPYLTGSHQVLRIPQLNMKDITYELKVSNTIDSENFYQFSGPNSLNGKVLNVIEDSIILEVDEANTDFDWKNFDIEVYEIETIEVTSSLTTKQYKDYMKPLFFKRCKSLVQDGILLDPDEIHEEDTPLNPNYVEYYFDILVDKEIEQQKLCNISPKDRAQGVFSTRMLECGPDGEENANAELYGTEEQESINAETLYDTEDFEEDC